MSWECGEMVSHVGVRNHESRVRSPSLSSVAPETVALVNRGCLLRQVTEGARPAIHVKGQKPESADTQQSQAGDVCPRAEHLEVRALPPASWRGSLNAKVLPSWRDGGSRPSPATHSCQSSSAGSGWTQYSAQDSRDLGQSNQYLTGRSGVRFPLLALNLRGRSSARSERIGKSVRTKVLEVGGSNPSAPIMQRSSGRVTEGGSLEVRALPAALQECPCAHTEGPERAWFESILLRQNAPIAQWQSTAE